MDTEVEQVLENIRLMRVSKHLSIIELANRAEISNSYVYYMECKRKVPTLTVLNKIAKAMNVEMKDFF